MSLTQRPLASFTLGVFALSLLPLVGCGEKDKEQDKPKVEEKEKPKLPERPKEDELTPETKLDLSGPKAPEADTVIFAVNGALVPLACFDKAKGTVRGGTACGDLVPEGEQVYVYSEYTKALDTIGGPKNALCEVGDRPTSRSATTVDGGATYEFAVWPKSAAPLVQASPSKSREERVLAWDDEQKGALMAAITKHRSRAGKGELRPQQLVEFDIDGDGKNELFFSAIVAHPSSADINLFSGIWMAPGGDMGALTLVDESKRETDAVFVNGTVDLKGDGQLAVWTGVTWDGGSGDRVVVLENGKAKPLSKFSCGA